MERWTRPRRYASIPLDPDKYMVWKPHVATREKAEKMAQRRDQYEASKLPLFAAQIVPNDPNDYLVSSQEWADKFNFLLRKQFRAARLIKFLLAKHLSVEQMARLEQRRRCMPASSEYEVTFWRDRLQEQIAGTLTIDYEMRKQGGAAT